MPMRSQHKRYTLIALIIVAALFAAACEQKSINQIKAEPNRYSNREVAIVGQVTQSMSLLGRGAYEVDDGTGRLWVVSRAGVPRKGARVIVKGTIRDAFNLEAVVRLPQPLSSVLVMMESEHRAR
jgi:hypothetical protein